jgi:chemotaxis signal transduction protein
MADYITDCLQMTAQQLAADIDEIRTRDDVWPIFSLSQLLTHYLDFELQPSSAESVLLAIRYGDELAMLRVSDAMPLGNVDRSSCHAIPAIAHPFDVHRIVKGIVVVDDKAIYPSDALRLLIDPVAALGFATQCDLPFAILRSDRNSRRPMSCNANDKASSLLFRLPSQNSTHDELVFCLPLAAVAEIIRPLPLLPLPMSSPILSGYVYWRHIPIPVVDLAICFGMDPQDALSGPSNPTSSQNYEESKNRLIIARAAGGRFLSFHCNQRIQRTSTPHSIKSSMDWPSDYPSLGVFETEYGRLIVPDLAAILDRTYLD